MVHPIHKLQEEITSLCNIVYKSVDGRQLQLDVFVPSKKLGEEPWHELLDSPTPTLVYYHGGGWVEGDRFSRFLEVLPYLEKGWAVINVDYRLLQETDLLGGIEDCLDALNWVGEHAVEYNLDTTQVYVSGESAGGHLALLTGMMDQESMRELFAKKRTQKVAGIINWFGITDVGKAVDFWNDTEYTRLINQGSKGTPESHYKRISPISYVTEEIPPIISFHGDADINVDVDQSSELHRKLDEFGVKNQLVIVPGKKHGGFSAEELTDCYDQIWKFFN
ncbi:MAG: alpha/beta hydrolase [Bacteroidota bacterium]